jgi:hypothetical protein
VGYNVDLVIIKKMIRNEVIKSLFALFSLPTYNNTINIKGLEKN